MIDLKDYERMFANGNYFTIAVEVRKLIDALEAERSVSESRFNDRNLLDDANISLNYEVLRLRKALEAADELAELVTNAGETWPKLKGVLRRYRAAREKV